MGVVDAIYKLKYFIICQQKNTGKMARAQGKHREFGVNWERGNPAQGRGVGGWVWWLEVYPPPQSVNTITHTANLL